MGKFVPFSELASWYDSITDEEKLMVASFDEDTEPQDKEALFEAALAAHAALPAPLDTYSDITPAAPLDLLTDVEWGQSYHNSLAAALTYSDAEPAFYHDMLGTGHGTSNSMGGFMQQGNFLSESLTIPYSPESLGAYGNPAGLHLVPKPAKQEFIAPINDPQTKIA
jgi:hypothetical protein